MRCGYVRYPPFHRLGPVGARTGSNKGIISRNIFHADRLRRIALPHRVFVWSDERDRTSSPCLLDTWTILAHNQSEVLSYSQHVLHEMHVLGCHRDYTTPSTVGYIGHTHFEWEATHIGALLEPACAL